MPVQTLAAPEPPARFTRSAASNAINAAATTGRLPRPIHPSPPVGELLYFFCITLSARMAMRSIIVTLTVCFLLTGGAAAHAQTTPPAAATPDPVAQPRWTSRPGEVQGHDQRADAVRRSAPGHRSQSRRGRLDRGAAQELRLPDRARQVRLRSAAMQRAAAAAAATPAWRWAAGVRAATRFRPASTPIR